MTAAVTWYPAEAVMAAARARVLPTRSVLDVGVGIRPQLYFTPDVHLCVEPNPAYVAYLQRCFQEPRYVIFHAPWDEVLPRLVDGAVESVIALDFIEHLDKAEGCRFLNEAQRIARRQVVIFTPLGFLPQNYDDQERDLWGLHPGKWQTHHSGWGIEDFTPEWELVCCKEWRNHDGNNRPLSEPSGVLWAFRTL